MMRTTVRKLPPLEASNQVSPTDLQASMQLRVHDGRTADSRRASERFQDAGTELLARLGLLLLLPVSRGSANGKPLVMTEVTRWAGSAFRQRRGDHDLSTIAGHLAVGTLPGLRAAVAWRPLCGPVAGRIAAR